jgi:hypothetical protein
MESWSQRAQRYRDRAEEMRYLTSQTKGAQAQVSFLNVAQEYEELALVADQEERSCQLSAQMQRPQRR